MTNTTQPVNQQPAKEGQTTTEFQISLGTAIFGVLVALGVITPEEASAYNGIVGQVAGAVITAASALGYSVSRGMAKKV